MNSSLTQRLLGATVLLIICVVLWPLVFKPADDPAIKLQSQIPDAPALEVFEIPRQKKPELLEPVLALQEDQRGDIDETIETVIPDVEIATLEVGETVVQNTPEPDLERTEPASAVDVALSSVDEAVPEVESVAEELDPTGLEPEPVAIVKEKQAKQYRVEDEPTPVIANKDATLWALQAGVYGDPVNAERQADRFRKLGYPVVVQQRTPNERELSFVFVGPYYDKEQARTDLLVLEDQAIKTIIVSFRP